MSGHSKWSQIRRQKGVNDARRGQLFTKLGREITVAARAGGGDPDANFRLRLAIQKARESNMPADNIQRAIARGVGGTDVGSLDEIAYEGYGPGGVAIMVEAMTDNRNRTVAEVRNVFSRNGGNLGETGSVGWMFEPRGVITVAADGRNPEEIELAAIDAGAADVTVGNDEVTVLTEPHDLDAVRTALAEQFKVIDAENTMMPTTTVELDEKHAAQLVKLIEKLEDLDDVQRVHTNTEFSDEMLAEMENAAAR
jgi:YebC/PmpR family DNA-binding regulatory protein